VFRYLHYTTVKTPRRGFPGILNVHPGLIVVLSFDPQALDLERKLARRTPVALLRGENARLVRLQISVKDDHKQTYIALSLPLFVETSYAVDYGPKTARGCRLRSDMNTNSRRLVEQGPDGDRRGPRSVRRWGADRPSVD